MHAILPLILCLVLSIVFLTILADKLKVAYPILLVIAGLTIGFIPGLPPIRIDPDLIFFIFLPPLLFEASWTISLKEMRKWWRIIGSFAFLVVFFTAFLVAIVANHFIPGISIALGFVLGGIVSPPDAVSTGAITKFVKIPKSTSAILEGESLLNDASSLIIFRFALAAVGTGQFIWQDASLSFLWMVIGGTIIGLAIAWVFRQMHNRLKTDAPTDITLTLVTPYFMYYLAETAHASGVLAVVSGGLYMSYHRLTFLSSSSRLKSFSVWESFIFVLNGFVFLIIGLGLPEIVAGMRASGIPLGTAIGYGVLVTGVLIFARMVSAYAALISTLLFRPQVAHQMQFKRRRNWLTPLVLGWTGMRGVVSLAAALAIPLTLNGQPFPHRNLILFITFVVIFLTLVVQGLTLPYVIKKLNPFQSLDNASAKHVERRKQMKADLKQHVYQHVKKQYNTVYKGHAGMEKILKHWEDQANSQDVSWVDETTKLILLEIFELQRSYLNELNKTDEIDEETIRHQVYQIDLEEERLRYI